MPDKPKRPPLAKGKGALTSQLPSNQAPKRPLNPPVSKGRKHAALKGNPTVPVTAEQWKNINQAIEETVELVLSKNLTLDGYGPDCWEMDEGLGVALVAEIRRPIKETCTLSDPKLEKELRKMARDVTQKEFRFPYKGGGVWFRFKMTDLQKATQRVDDQVPDVAPKADHAEEPTDINSDSMTETNGSS
ncbi:hypothetical protein F5Y13DRAFT_200993 [Hypoxylon sp. FL1857]|nr:hypothetical protein F5Y13DRAFT_200993 [Hypoxylon sp. FL1857]